MLMQQQALYDAGETNHTARQFIKQGRISASERHCHWVCIEVEMRVHGWPSREQHEESESLGGVYGAFGSTT